MVTECVWEYFSALRAKWNKSGSVKIWSNLTSLAHKLKFIFPFCSNCKIMIHNRWNKRNTTTMANQIYGLRQNEKAHSSYLFIILCLSDTEDPPSLNFCTLSSWLYFQKYASDVTTKQKGSGMTSGSIYFFLLLSMKHLLNYNLDFFLLLNFFSNPCYIVFPPSSESLDFTFLSLLISTDGLFPMNLLFSGPECSIWQRIDLLAIRGEKLHFKIQNWNRADCEIQIMQTKLNYCNKELKLTYDLFQSINIERSLISNWN